jgi:hypothetical protein
MVNCDHVLIKTIVKLNTIAMKKILLLLSMLYLAGVGIAQQTPQYNLPPGAVLKPNAKIEDLSYKLGDLPDKVDQNYIEQNFLEHFTSDELNAMQTESSSLYSYYMEANDFYTKLSPRVKSIFSVNELWDIYYFDADLKQQIILIK